MYKVFITSSRKKGDLILIPNENLYTGYNSIKEYFGEVNSFEEDLLNVASGIYATDLAIVREEREHYIRTISVEIEVTNYHAFQRIRDKLEYALYILSRDNWRISFSPKSANPTTILWERNDGYTLLFSGGIDSMVAASDFLCTNNNLVLASHITQGNSVIEAAQDNIVQVLEEHYKRKLEHLKIKVYARNKGEFSFPEDRENTQRTRSLLFIIIGAIITRRKGFFKLLYMAENGQFAIHLPLNHSRIGPFSTHTADPEYLNKIQEIMQILLDNPDFEIINPYLYLTKGEVFRKLPEELKQVAHLSVSCWKISRIHQHCGFCIPCISRRISIEYNGCKYSEYKRDLFNEEIESLGDEDLGKRNLIDYLEFITRFIDIKKSEYESIQYEFPELFNPCLDKTKAIELYKRVALQSMEVFKKYPIINKLIH